ncbi:MAG: OmpA family protein, partial [Flavobacteriales bacterium]|nr:OmpA family protein [Flavobacteriales bacterium]
SNRNETDFDIFFAPRHLQWQSASVLDFPINSDSDDLSLVVLNDDEMYVCSNRTHSEGFDVYLLSRTKNESLATGFYLELTLDGNPVSGVEVKWVEPSGFNRGTSVFENTTDPQGVISLDELPSDRVLSMRIGSVESPVIEGTVVRIVNANGEVVRAYAVNTSGVLSVDFLPLDSINDLDLNDLLDLSGLPSRYPPIYTLYFDLNISTPTTQSADQLEAWWQTNAQDFIVKIQEFALVLEGHADVTGTTDSNENLSKKRAVWFKAWLISKGVHAEQVSTRGMGARFPVKRCPNISDPFSDCPPEVHAVNRRVELRWEVL